MWHRCLDHRTKQTSRCGKHLLAMPCPGLGCYYHCLLIGSSSCGEKQKSFTSKTMDYIPFRHFGNNFIKKYSKFIFPQFHEAYQDQKMFYYENAMFIAVVDICGSITNGSILGWGMSDAFIAEAPEVWFQDLSWYRSQKVMNGLWWKTFRDDWPRAMDQSIRCLIVDPGSFLEDIG